MEPTGPKSGHLGNSSSGSPRLETFGSSGSNDSNDTPNTPTRGSQVFVFGSAANDTETASSTGRHTEATSHGSGFQFDASFLDHGCTTSSPSADVSGGHDYGDLEDHDAKTCFSAIAHEVFFSRDRDYSSPEELVEKMVFERGTERVDLCPGCGLLLPLDWNEKDFYRCCLREYCNGCILDIVNKREFLDSCPMCSQPAENNVVDIAHYTKASQDGNPMATWMLGNESAAGTSGLKKNVNAAIALWTLASELGCARAHCSLGDLFYPEGDHHNLDAAILHYAEAAMSGNLYGRIQMAKVELSNFGSVERGLKHFIIASKMGSEKTLSVIRNLLAGGLATREQYKEALIGYQEAVEAMRSPSRDEAKKMLANGEWARLKITVEDFEVNHLKLTSELPDDIDVAEVSRLEKEELFTSGLVRYSGECPLCLIKLPPVEKHSVVIWECCMVEIW